MGHLKGAVRGTLFGIQGDSRLECNYLQIYIPLYFTIKALISYEQRLEPKKII